MNFDLLTSAGSALSLVDLLVALSLALLLGFGMAGVYRITFRGFTYERSFLITLVMMPPIVAVVMTFISTNLALSLGMVGALSIIRFRTVIKDSRDMVFLFWTIMVGLGCGTYNWTAVTVASVFIGAVLLILYWVEYGKRSRTDYVLVVKGDEEPALGSARQLLAARAPGARLRSLEHDAAGWELVVEVHAEGDGDVDRLEWVGELRSAPGVASVSVLAPQLALPI